ncbi:MAG TPA: hypothetical protein DER23_01315, partial [Clostridiales bacterium]|nr:hypothetical protein [Clostridiales bacterium]
YPTWPTNSLQANIYAQISLALNRIYTEWYRSRHYEFDITSSTAYDQNFIRGRNIFENISQLVDEVFNVYIIKPGRQEPFYAEYCNGSTVTCPGMSQWGTVSLAQQGYSPQAILEYYYGPVELITTDDIQEIEGSYPGYPLKLGSTGRWVQIKQFGMNRISVNYPAIPKVPVDGYYGPEMEAAVRAFQRIFSLDVDGVMGKATWYRTSYIYVAITKLAELTSEGHNPIFSEGSYPGYPLKIGSTGEPVRQAQFYLSMVDTYYDLIPPVTIDGIFGSETKNVVIQFQRLYGLTDDGIIGPVTWAQLVDVYLGIEENVFVPVAVLPLKDYPGYPIKPNASGTDVVYIQLILNRISTQFPTIPPITVDGKFGNATKEAVIAFQNLFGLAADGIVGPLTWNRMNDIYSTVSSGCISITGAGEKAYPGTVVKQGQSGPNVQYIQNSLNTIRTVFPQIPSLVVDSIFGASTKTAVETFQRITGLTVDGVVGENTWNRMNDYTTAVSNGCLSDWKIYTDISDHDFIPGQDEKVSSTDNRTQEIFSVYQRPQRILKIGCFGEDVKALKILLQSTAGENPFLMGENMFFGLSTKHAVQRFQRHLGMRADGIVTSELWDKLTEV